MNTLRLFKGIAVPEPTVEPVISSVSTHGLTSAPGRPAYWQLWGLDHDALASKEDLTLGDIDARAEERQAIYACGTYDGAADYAYHRNRIGLDNCALVVEFDTEVSSVGIDGNDFLFSVFTGGDPEKSRNVLAKLYGRKVLQYAERAWNSDNQDRRCALCELALSDRELIIPHYTNREVIGGRWGTAFENAFTVALPVNPGQIIAIHYPIRPPLPRRPSVTLGDIR